MARSSQGKIVDGTAARGIHLIRPQDRDRRTSQTPGLNRQTAIDDPNGGVEEPVDFIVTRDAPKNIVVPVDLRKGGSKG